MPFRPIIPPDRDLQTRNMMLHLIECINELASDTAITAKVIHDRITPSSAGRRESREALAQVQERVAMIQGALQEAVLENDFTLED